MRDRIGTTRSGKPIVLVWTFVDGIRIIESISLFTDAEDEFDSIAAGEAKCLLGQRSPDAVGNYEANHLEQVLVRKRMAFGEDKFWEVGARIGCLTSYDVNVHGQSLLYPRLIGRG